MKERINNIIENQREFQKLAGINIDTIIEQERNQIAENYLFKMIEEVIELKKEFPSVINKLSKDQRNANIQRVREELSDVILFLVNFILVWKFSTAEIVDMVERVQENNFKHVKNLLLAKLNKEILDVPAYTSCIGHGNSNPKYVFVGMNPSSTITHGYKAWSNREDGSSSVLLLALENLGILEDCYLTNVVKNTTDKNSEPSQNDVDFWKEYYEKEINILKANNPSLKVIAMGNFTSDNINCDIKIPHPAFILRGGLTQEQYEEEIKQKIK